MTARERGAARRYAQALFELALERGQAEDVRAALRSVAATLAGQRALRAVLLSPAVSGDRKKGIVSALWGAREGAEALVARLVALLAERHRMGALERVEEQFTALWNAHRQVLSAEVVAAVPLDAGQLDGLRRAVRTATGRDVEFKTAVDARVLGGVRLTMDGRVYDGTVRAQLAALRTRLGAGDGLA
jgi:F-type H+-transporting ATPase subunit delta